MSYDPLDRAGAFLTFISTDPSRAAEVLDIAAREFRTFMDEGPTDHELQAAKNKIASGATLKGELPMGRLTEVGLDWVYRGVYEPLSRQIDCMFQVTAADVLDVVRAYDLTATTVLALGPLESL